MTGFSDCGLQKNSAQDTLFNLISFCFGTPLINNPLSHMTIDPVFFVERCGGRDQNRDAIPDMLDIPLADVVDYISFLQPSYIDSDNGFPIHCFNNIPVFRRIVPNH